MISLTKKGRRTKEHGGVALVAVLVALLLISVVVTEFSTSTNIDYFAANNARDDMRAHFLSRSAVNLGELMIRVQTEVIDKHRKNIGDIQLADYTQFFMGAFCGGEEEVDGIAEQLGARGDDMQGLGIPYGHCDVAITTDDDKINLNCAAGDAQARLNLHAKLESLLYPDVFRRFFETRDAEGNPRDPTLLVKALIDYVDRDLVEYDPKASAAPEGYGYSELDDPYKPKNNRLDTIGEIKLVRGVDDEFWSLFGDEFTVYGGCKTNVSAVSSPTMIASLIFLAAKDPEDPVFQNPAMLWALVKRVSEAQSLGRVAGQAFATLKEFADFVKNPNATGLAGLLGLEGDAADALGGASNDQVEVKGVDLDMSKLQQIAEAGPRRTYRVEASAVVGNLTKKIVAVWDTAVQTQNARIGGATKRGAWVFWRED